MKSERMPLLSQGTPEAARARQETGNRFSPTALGKTHPCRRLDLGPPASRNFYRLNLAFYCLSLLWQPEQMNTSLIQDGSYPTGQLQSRYCPSRSRSGAVVPRDVNNVLGIPQHFQACARKGRGTFPGCLSPTLCCDASPIFRGWR